MRREPHKMYWDELKNEVLEKWGRLSEEELDQIRGHWKLLSDKLVEHYGFRPEDAHKKVYEFLKKHDLTGNGHASHRIQEIYEHSKEKLKHIDPKEMLESTEEFVKENPLAVVGITALAAAALGIFIGFKMGKDS